MVYKHITTFHFYSDFLKITKENQEEFTNIAQVLFDEYAIQTHDALYRLTEIEFYWNSPNHVDSSIYQHKHVDPKSGDWFFHYSGVDIALKNEETGGYGGILIRGMYDINKYVPIKGPMVCTMKLFSGNNAFTQSIKTQIVKHHFPKAKIINQERESKSSETGKQFTQTELCLPDKSQQMITDYQTNFLYLAETEATQLSDYFLLN